MKDLAELENEFESKGNIDHNDIINVTLAKKQPNLKRFNIQVIKAAILLMIITIVMIFFFGYAEDPDFQKGHLQFSQINLTEKQTTTVITTTGGKCCLQIICFLSSN